MQLADLVEPATTAVLTQECQKGVIGDLSLLPALTESARATGMKPEDPITVARLGTTQAAWILLFGRFAPAERLLAFSLATALTFALTRALVGVILLPLAYRDLVEPRRAPESKRHAAAAT